MGVACSSLGAGHKRNIVSTSHFFMQGYYCRAQAFHRMGTVKLDDKIENFARAVVDYLNGFDLSQNDYDYPVAIEKG